MMAPRLLSRLLPTLVVFPYVASCAVTEQVDVVSPRIGTPIVVDGELGEPFWEQAAQVGPFGALETGVTPREGATTARILHDSGMLYVGVTCAGASPEAGRRQPRDHDQVWGRDHVEVFIDPTVDTDDYLHLVVDHTGTLFDSRRATETESPEGPAWDGDWQAGVAASADGWSVEIGIPFDSVAAGAPEPGDVWRLKIGRDGGKREPAMWPVNPTSSFHSRGADGALYFVKQDLLASGDFEGGALGDGAPEPWGVSWTSPEVDNKPQGEVHTVEGGLPPGKQALLFKKFATALYWPQVWDHGYKLQPGGIYEFSVMVRGTLPRVNLRATATCERQPVKMSRGVAPTGEFSRLRFAFVVPEKSTEVAVGLSAPAGVAGEVLYDNAILRRLIRADDAVERQFAPPDWSPDPDPVHGLLARTERAGHKPWDLYWRDQSLLTHRVIFRDRKYGTELWMLGDSPVTEYVVTASIWPGWNADGSALMLPGRRIVDGEARSPWLSNADFSRLMPMPTGMMPLWDLADPNVYYRHEQGEVTKVDLRNGDQQVLATWEPRGQERSYGLTKDNRSVWVVDWDGGVWVPYDPADDPLPYVKVLDCYGPDPDNDGRLPSHLLTTETDSGPKFRIMTGTRVYTDTGRTERLHVPISGRKEYLETWVSGRVQFPEHAAVPETKDLDELFAIYQLYPSCSHGHLSYSPDGEYTCWDGSPSFYRTRDGGDAHDVAISPNGWCYHVCWFIDPRFFVTCVRGYRTNYDRPVNANLLSQVYTDGTWQAVCDIKMRPNAFYYGGNFATLSRDGTKVHYESSMTGVHKNYIAVLSRPQPPPAITCSPDGEAIVLTWSPPPHSKEIKGTLVYRSARSGSGYRLLTPVPVTGTSYRDAAVAAGRAHYYCLSSIEHCGLEGGLSDEVRGGVGLGAATREPVTIYAEAEGALADLASGDKSGISRGRDAMGASSWYYVYRTPDAEQGSAGVSIDACAAGEYHVWLRTRKTGVASAEWGVAIDGRRLGSVEPTAVETWEWVKASETPIRLRAGRHALQLSTTSVGAQADLACLTTDRAFVPEGVRPEDSEAPAPVADLKAERLRDRVVQLTWEGGSAPDLSHYNVYASREPIARADQEFLLASPTYREFIDWGLRPAATYHYAVTAVDRHGNESPLGAMADVETDAPANPRVEVELAFDQAALDGPFAREKADGTHAASYVILPKSEEAAEATVTWRLDVPHEGTYHLWLRYLPRGAASVRAAAVEQNIGLLVDDKRTASLGGGLTDLSAPDSALRAEFWTWRRPVSAGLVGVDLPAGEHELTLTALTPEIRYDVLLVTDEPSFLPSDGRLSQR